jgi:hypothetical protein
MVLSEDDYGSRRIRFTVFLSVDYSKLKKVSTFIAKRLAPHFGGLSIFGSDSGSSLMGYWVDGAQCFKEMYTGQLVEECVLCVVLSVLPKYEERAHDEIRSTIMDAAHEFALNSKFVHVETFSVHARHFDISEDL